MKRLLPVAALVFVLLGGVPVAACDNDSETQEYEERYQQHYEPQFETPQPTVLASRTSVTSPVAVASTSLGGILLIASLVYSFLRSPRIE